MTHDIDSNLNEQLAKQRDGAPDEVVAVLTKAAQDVEEGGEAKGIELGETAPDFTLPDATGKLVNLAERLKVGPVVVTFYRGSWCPYCNIQLNALQAELAQIHAAGGTLIAISPQTPDEALSVSERNDLAFDVLSDVDQSVIQAFRVQHRVPPAVEDLHRNKFRKDLSELTADGSWNLPVPATFVLDTGGVVRARYVGADYTQRMEPSEISASLRSLASGLEA